MIEITSTATGCKLSIRVSPKAKKTSVGGVHNGALKIAVTAPPEDGKANKAVIRQLAKAFSISRSDVEIITGQTSRQKVVAIHHMTCDQVRRLLENWL